MQLSDYVQEHGRKTWLAKRLKVPPQLVGQWASAVRPVPKERCPEIERATDGQVIVEHLRPDVVWQRVEDPQWPHGRGRPCIDVAAGLAA